MQLKRIIWTFLGLFLPLIAAGIFVPYLLRELGYERFGLLTLAWGLIGYAGVLDLGMGRAVTQLASKSIAQGKLELTSSIVFTAIKLTAFVGVLGAVAFIVFIIFGGSDLIKTIEVSHEEVLYSSLLIAIAIPTQAICAVYRGLSEAFFHFRGIALLRIFLGAVNFIAPVIVISFTRNLAWIILAMALGRIIATLGYRFLAIKALANINSFANIYSSKIAKELLVFGGWVTVSSLVSPFLVQADRFFIAYILSAAVVATYVIPFEVVVQCLIIVGAITTVMFPRFSRLIVENPSSLNLEFKYWINKVSIIMGVICVAMGFTLPLLLPLWIGGELNPESVIVGQILCVGVFANSIGSMYYILLQAKGLSKVTAMIHLIELPIYLTFLGYLIVKYGVLGAACAWSCRMIVDALILKISLKLIHD